MSKFFTWTKGDRTNAADILRSAKDVPLGYIDAQDLYYTGDGMVQAQYAMIMFFLY